MREVRRRIELAAQFGWHAEREMATRRRFESVPPVQPHNPL